MTRRAFSDIKLRSPTELDTDHRSAFGQPKIGSTKRPFEVKIASIDLWNLEGEWADVRNSSMAK